MPTLYYYLPSLAASSQNLLLHSRATTRKRPSLYMLSTAPLLRRPAPPSAHARAATKAADDLREASAPVVGDRRMGSPINAGRRGCCSPGDDRGRCA
eukprot:679667-Pyramimonas_sp.AAC.1